MQTQDLERIRFVTRHYGDLQGLRYRVPVGGALLAFGFGESSSGAISFLVALALGASSLGLRFVAKAYYRRTFGEIERQPSQLRSLLWILWVFGLELLLRSAGAERFTYTYILCGSLLLSQWVELECRWNWAYDLLLGVLLLGLGVLGTSSAFFLPALMRGGLPEVLSGTALILAGLLDHRELVRVLGAPDAEPEEAQR